MRKEIDNILEKFPEYRNRIITLYDDDDDFKTLCEDYLVSMQGIEECKLNFIKDKGLESEFLEICLELEKEIIRLLGSRR
jgi:hypothetical protein